MVGDESGEELLDVRESRVRLPHPDASPGRSVLRRLVAGIVVLFAVAVVVYLDRDGYKDAQDNPLSLLDALYYATVSLSTTGYGDITPLTPEARLVNVLVITPLRVLFLIILVGTTLEVLTERTREQFRLQRWRSIVRQHTVVIGYGTKGRSAVRALLNDGYDAKQIVVVDPDPRAAEDANRAGVAAVIGDGTRGEVLEDADISEAERVIIAANRDDAAVLMVLTVRQRNPTAQVVAAVREAENAPLLAQSGATNVVISSEAAGRLLGVSALSPASGQLIEDLLLPDAGLDMYERPTRPEEVGCPLRRLDDVALGLVREGRLHRLGEPETEQVAAGDTLLVVRPARR